MVFNPNPPGSGPGGWFNPNKPNMTGTGAMYPPGYRPPNQPTGGASGRPRFVMTANGPMWLPSDMSDDEARQVVQAYDDEIARIQQFIRESQGFQRWQLEQQLADAQKGRDNAVKIAEMQAQTSRYGTDVGAQTALAQLKENQRQFDLRHGIEQQELGLRRAETATNFLATPDRYAQAGNYLALSSRVLAGQPGAGTYGRDVAPRANTMADFAVLESGGNPYGNRGNAAAAANAGGAAGADARQKALQTIMKDYTPSNGVGLDANDYAVLQASHAIMNMNLTPKQQQAVTSNPEYAGILASNMRNLGQDPNAWWKRQQQGGVGQGSVRAA